MAANACVKGRWLGGGGMGKQKEEVWHVYYYNLLPAL